MNKRFLSALLCMCLLSGLLAVSAFADTVIVDNIDSTDGDNYAAFDENLNYTQQIDINAIAYDNPEGVRDIDAYKVELIWGDMAFAWGFEDEQEQIWNPVDHTYTTVERDEADKGWYLIDNESALSLPDDTDGSYSAITANTKQNYVLMFNHSSKPVDANVSIAKAAGAGDELNASIADANFGVTGVAAQDGSLDFALQYDTVTGVIYSTDNGTAAAVSVSLSGEPAEGYLNADTSTTVATVTVKLSLPAA